MKKQDFRIGNYIDAWRINDTWEPTKIKSGSEIDFIIAQEKQNIHRPIVLTREWVERFAYDFKAKGHPDCAISCSVRIDDEKPVDVYFVIGNWYHKLEYVHELQNFYYDVVREELKEKELCHEH